MASKAETGDAETKWDAYSDFALVSKWVTESISDAMDAYATIDNAVMTGEKLQTTKRTDLRSDILSAAMRLQVELESERDRGADYAEEILDRWEGEEGYIERFRGTSFVNNSPDWLKDLVTDIRRAGWELGYLKAGRREEAEDQGNEEDSEVFDLIGEMEL